MPSIEIRTGFPSAFARQHNANALVDMSRIYTLVKVEGHEEVLVREIAGRWYFIRPNGDFDSALTQREAVVGALGFDLPNWLAPEAEVPAGRV
jgi:hypothetical protein